MMAIIIIITALNVQTICQGEWKSDIGSTPHPESHQHQNLISRFGWHPSMCLRIVLQTDRQTDRHVDDHCTSSARIKRRAGNYSETSLTIVECSLDTFKHLNACTTTNMPSVSRPATATIDHYSTIVSIFRNFQHIQHSCMVCYFCTFVGSHTDRQCADNWKRH